MQYLVHVRNVGSQILSTVEEAVGPFYLNSFSNLWRTQVHTISALKMLKKNVSLLGLRVTFITCQNGFKQVFLSGIGTFLLISSKNKSQRLKGPTISSVR